MENAELEKLKEKVLHIAEDLSTTKEKDDYGYEIYPCSYDDTILSNKTLSDIFESSNPKYTFEEMLNDWALDYQIECGEDYLEEFIKERLTDEEQEMFKENSDEIWDMLHDYIYFYYDEKEFNNDLYVNIMVDCGNGNYDYTMDNVLNWYGRHERCQIKICL